LSDSITNQKALTIDEVYANALENLSAYSDVEKYIESDSASENKNEMVSKKINKERKLVVISLQNHLFKRGESEEVTKCLYKMRIRDLVTGLTFYSLALRGISLFLISAVLSYLRIKRIAS
jgi:Ca2+-dependent lipid-binding protein